jgi:transcriptional regulator with PAS, ATPase and Fis domain
MSRCSSVISSPGLAPKRRGRCPKSRRTRWRVFLRYPWPGNVRELQNAIQRGVILSRSRPAITVKDLPPKVAGLDISSAKMLSEAVEKRVSLDRLEHDYIRAILDSVNGNKTEAANILRIDRKTLYRKLDDRPGPDPDTQD